ncbi:MAG TPA: hypothetical protein PKV72_02250, partial [Candidatus Peribacteria bacterium]|nr:hypothetical protein [Candidatus Peribacteria bacterium]
VFTKISRWEFLLVTALAVTPGAILYAYIGALPFQYEVLIALLGLAAFGAYWVLDTYKKDILRWMRAGAKR